jgi:hypothetical protein
MAEPTSGSTGKGFEGLSVVNQFVDQSISSMSAAVRSGIASTKHQLSAVSTAAEVRQLLMIYLAYSSAFF